jgi:hypothetical protein
MTIVIGRGNKRLTAIVPCAALIKQAPVEQQQKMLADFCTLAGIKTE